MSDNLLESFEKRLIQEFDGENEELLQRLVTKFSGELTRRFWKIAQKWTTWSNEGPVLVPDFTRLFYKKGNTIVTLQEFSPAIRLLKFRTRLEAENSQSAVNIHSEEYKSYSLALPYVVFIYKFVEGKFVEVRVFFNDRPLKNLQETPLKPYLSNIDDTHKVCLGHSFNHDELIVGNITQQMSYVSSHFWSSVFSDEWSANFWNVKEHFKNSNESRLSSLTKWQEASLEDPLFVIEGIDWPKSNQEKFGDVISSLVESDSVDFNFNQEIIKEITDNFIDNCLKTIKQNFEVAKQRAMEKTLEKKESNG